MPTSRRSFIQTMGAGAIAAKLSASTPQAANQTPAAATKGGIRKMVVRADDIGHSNVCNIGAFEAIENGIVTAADVMMADPGTVDALERLSKMPWISVGWHGHMWGAPVTDVKKVPSLVEHGGPFDGRFKINVSSADGVVFEEALMELRNQMIRCVKILGRAPDTGGGGRNATTPWGKAMKVVSEEFGLTGNFTVQAPPNAKQKAFADKYEQHIKDAKARGEEWAKYYSVPGTGPALNRGQNQSGTQRQEPDPRFADRKIIMPVGTYAYMDVLTDSISAVEKNYDPVKYYTEDRAGILDYPPDYIFAQSWHPGYVDYYVYRLGERVNRARAQQFVVCRTEDVAALTSPVLKAWIKKNRIELVNFRDAMFGSTSYQNHLEVTGSDLWMRG